MTPTATGRSQVLTAMILTQHPPLWRKTLTVTVVADTDCDDTDATMPLGDADCDRASIRLR